MTVQELRELLKNDGLASIIDVAGAAEITRDELLKRLDTGDLTTITGEGDGLYWLDHYPIPTSSTIIHLPDAKE